MLAARRASRKGGLHLHAAQAHVGAKQSRRSRTATPVGSVGGALHAAVAQRAPQAARWVCGHLHLPQRGQAGVGGGVHRLALEAPPDVFRGVRDLVPRRLVPRLELGMDLRRRHHLAAGHAAVAQPVGERGVENQGDVAAGRPGHPAGVGGQHILRKQEQGSRKAAGSGPGQRLAGLQRSRAARGSSFNLQGACQTPQHVLSSLGLGGLLGLLGRLGLLGGGGGGSAGRRAGAWPISRKDRRRRHDPP